MGRIERTNMSKKKSGITLVEIILAMAFIGILTVGFLPVFVFSMLQTSQSGQRTQALYDIKSVVEAEAQVTTVETNMVLTLKDGSTLTIPIETASETKSYGKDGQTIQLFTFRKR